MTCIKRETLIANSEKRNTTGSRRVLLNVNVNFNLKRSYKYGCQLYTFLLKVLENYLKKVISIFSF